MAVECRSRDLTGPPRSAWAFRKDPKPGAIIVDGTDHINLGRWASPLHFLLDAAHNWVCTPTQGSARRRGNLIRNTGFASPGLPFPTSASFHSWVISRAGQEMPLSPRGDRAIDFTFIWLRQDNSRNPYFRVSLDFNYLRAQLPSPLLSSRSATEAIMPQMVVGSSHSVVKLPHEHRLDHRHS